MTEQMSETPISDLLATMTAASIDVSGLDEQSLMLVRLAALVAVDAPPASYLLNLGAASEMGIDEGRVRDVLAAVAPIVGTTRIVSATGNIARALGSRSSCGIRKRVVRRSKAQHDVRESRAIDVRWSPHAHGEKVPSGQRYSCCLSQRVATDPQIGGR